MMNRYPCAFIVIDLVLIVNCCWIGRCGDRLTLIWDQWRSDVSSGLIFVRTWRFRARTRSDFIGLSGSKFTDLFLNGAAGASAASEALNSILMLTFTPQGIRVPEMCRSLRHDECGWDKQILWNRRTLAPGGHRLSHQFQTSAGTLERRRCAGAASLSSCCAQRSSRVRTLNPEAQSETQAADGGPASAPVTAQGLMGYG